MALFRLVVGLVAFVVLATNVLSYSDVKRTKDTDVGSMPARHQMIGGIKLGRPVRVMDSFDGTYLIIQNFASDACVGQPIQMASVATGICYESETLVWNNDDEYDINADDFFSDDDFFNDDFFDDDFFDDDFFDDDFFDDDFFDDDFFDDDFFDDDFFDDDFFDDDFFGADDSPATNGDRIKDHGRHHVAKRRRDHTKKFNRTGKQLNNQASKRRHRTKAKHSDKKSARGLRSREKVAGLAALVSTEYNVYVEVVAGIEYYVLNSTGYFGANCTGKSITSEEVLSTQCTTPQYTDDDISYDDDFFDDDFFDDDTFDDDFFDDNFFDDDFFDDDTFDDDFFDDTFFDDDLFDDDFSGYDDDYNPLQLGTSQLVSVSSQPFDIPIYEGVVASYYLTESACFQGSTEIAPYVLWDMIGGCLQETRSTSSMLIQCSDGSAVYDSYYGSNTCAGTASYQFELYSSCNLMYSTVECTGSIIGSPVPTMEPTSSHATVAVFSVLQPVSNITVDEMNSGPALSAFVAAVYSTLNAPQVTSVDISSVAAKNSMMARMHLQGTSDTVVVGYDVTFQTSADSVDSIYISLSTQLAYDVEIGVFQSNLQYEASLQNPVPTSLLTCSATEAPSISTYTVLATDDNTGSAVAVLSTGAIAAISLAGICVFVGLIVAVYLFRYHRSEGYSSGEKTSNAISETKNPVVSTHIELSAMPAVPALSPPIVSSQAPQYGSVTAVSSAPAQGVVVAVTAPAFPQQAYAVAVEPTIYRKELLTGDSSAGSVDADTSVCSSVDHESGAVDVNAIDIKVSDESVSHDPKL